ncbi:Allantoate permease [Schizosaccharomyces pombe]|uniref:Uncharacterized transporter C1773.15 n=1 Tax=Schizosaccharomyces pombe (strain 972 / ATCC 24843) TaxID=284812 RepID=YGDF_SCHPO|nr:putative dipeptide transmembrane transporter [Schizosaccharomyces pombe]O94572.1 RecName: Full=Uncharacterized transporter C1773.15 [Schizosaccharomyces pombe 972h-]CAA21920.1 dipeptide transmembrane transporter (predicted) [Schizosaccharomyces pombe]|eukprot:NP_595130.1 putative dipeptide transmembrane transporter [Schizosaccharomyces pombe]
MEKTEEENYSIKELGEKGSDSQEDVAVIFAEKHPIIDKSLNRKLKLKTDLWVMPLLCLISAFQYMDKSTSNYSSIMGIRTDLNMVGNQYNWVGTSFYLGFMVFSLPLSTLLQKFPLSKVTSAFIVAWGILMTLTCLVHSYASYIATRTLLGILESVITPAFVLFIAQWYRKEEQFFRMAFLVAWNGLGGLIGGSMSYGLYKRELENNLTMSPWRILFIITGLITIINGVFIFIHIPDEPSKAWFLSEKEKDLVLKRLDTDHAGLGSKKFKKYQILEACRDVRMYLYFFLQIAVAIPNGGLSNFSSIMLKNLGYVKGKALLMNMPTSSISFAALTLFGLIPEFTNRRMDIALVGLAINLTSGSLIAFAKPTHAQLAGYWLFGISPIPYICILSCISSNSAGHTKKVFMSAVSMIGYCVGNMVGPQTFRSTQAPKYQGAKVSFVVCYCVAIFIIIAIYAVNVRENRRRDEKNEYLSNELSEEDKKDLTDFENPEFRYSI